MPSGNLEILHDFSAITKKVIITIAENSNPAAEVKPRVVLDAPHTAGDVTVFENLRLVLHRVKCYESTDGATLENLLHSWTVLAKKTKPLVRRFFYQVDGGRTNVTESTGSEVWTDPVSTETEVVDERLADAMEVILFSEGGSLRHQDINYQLLDGGGWKLIGGEQFSEDEKWTAVAIWDVDVVEDGSGSASSDVDIHEVDDDGDFDSDFYSKENIAEGGVDILTTTFPDFALIPTKTRAKFSTYTGNQKFWVLQFASGNTVRYNEEDLNQIRLGKGEMIELFWKLNENTNEVKCYVRDDKTGYEKVGQRVFVDRWDFVDGKNGNKVLLNGGQHSLNDGIIKRLYDVHVSKLSKTVTETEWAASADNKHYYAVDLIAQTLRVPLDTEVHYRALKTFDGVNGYPGKYQADGIKQTSGSIEIPSRDFKNDGTAGPDLTGTDGGANVNSKRTFTFTIGTQDENTVKAVRQYAAVYI